MTTVRCSVCGDTFYTNAIDKEREGHCGHGYCANCFHAYCDLVNKNFGCWKCTLQVELDEYVTTPPTLDWNQNGKSLPQQVESALRDQLIGLKEDYNHKKRFLEKNLAIMKCYLDTVNGKLMEINSFLLKPEESWLDNRRKFEAISNMYETIRERIYLRYGVPICFSTLTMDRFSKSEYLYTIYNKLRNGEKIYGVHRINNTLSYAKFTYKENKILMHPFSLSDEPIKSTIISFEDFKQCFCKQKTKQTFVNIYCPKLQKIITIVIEMNVSRNSARFITFCTGEYGFSFASSTNSAGKSSIEQRCPVTEEPNEHQNELKRILKLGNSCTGKVMPSDYCCDFSEDVLIPYNNEDVIVQMCPDGAVGFFSVLEGSKEYPAIGKVLKPKEFYDYYPINSNSTISNTPQVIFDCGIMVEVF